jgi:iron-sulfur cluster assembly protein
MIQVSEKAKEQIQTLLEAQGKELQSTYLRVGVKGGGCSGLSYDLSFDAELNDNDKVIEDKGVRVVVDKKSILYLVGTILDYSDGLNGKGFAFQNPNATRTCGCGESFSV